MIAAETVLSGAEHPGTELKVLCSPAGFYIGYLNKDGSPYSRETTYLSEGAAENLIQLLRT